jgi:threonyl-tRNA synthetase
MLVIGDREAETQSVGVRHRKHADLGAKPVDEFVTMIAKQVADRALDE